MKTGLKGEGSAEMKCQWNWEDARVVAKKQQQSSGQMAKEPKRKQESVNAEIKKIVKEKLAICRCSA